MRSSSCFGSAKGSKEDLDQYRGTCPLVIISHILARVVCSRILAYVEKIGQLSNSQWAFVRRATRDVVLIFRIICEFSGAPKSRSEQLEETQRRRPRAKIADKNSTPEENLLRTYNPFIDLVDIKQAFPNIGRDSLWLTLKHIGVPSKPISIVDGLHSLTKFGIQLPTGTSDEYELQRGLREGCPSSSTLFIIIHQDIPVSINGKKVDGLTFAFGEKGGRRGRNTKSAFSGAAPTTSISASLASQTTRAHLGRK